MKTNFNQNLVDKYIMQPISEDSCWVAEVYLWVSSKTNMILANFLTL